MAIRVFDRRVSAELPDRERIKSFAKKFFVTAFQQMEAEKKC
jgi:hypothetical protein